MDITSLITDFLAGRSDLLLGLMGLGICMFLSGKHSQGLIMFSFVAMMLFFLTANTMFVAAAIGSIVVGAVLRNWGM